MKKFIDLSVCLSVALSGVCLGVFPARALAQEEEGPAEEVEIVVEEKAPAWTGRFDFGYTWQSGRADKNELSLRAEAERITDNDEYRALAEFLYGEVEGVRNTQRFLSSFRWRRDWSEKWFGQSLTLYENDRVREIRNRVEQNLGVGYRYLDSERFSGSVVPGFTVQYTDEAGVNDHWDYLASLSEDFAWVINPAYRFEQDLNFLIDPADTEDFIIRFNAGIVGTVTKSINLSIRYSYLFENDVRDDVEETDQRIIASVGYAF